jgi:glucokinase
MNQPVHSNGARLLADIGGTNARFAIERGPGRIEESATLPCAGYATFVDAALGAGTGLGVGGLISANGRWVVLPSEGGHVAFSPGDERKQRILSYLWTKWQHVSAERLISGPGLATIHEALAATKGLAVAPLEPAQLVERALAGSDAPALEALEVFCGALGTMAANLAVTLCARGGIYIGGGVVPRLGEWFARSPFRARFENKGRFSSCAADIPVYVIHAAYPALAGAAALLEQHIQEQAQAHGARRSHQQPENDHVHA